MWNSEINVVELLRRRETLLHRLFAKSRPGRHSPSVTVNLFETESQTEKKNESEIRKPGLGDTHRKLTGQPSPDDIASSALNCRHQRIRVIRLILRRTWGKKIPNLGS